MSISKNQRGEIATVLTLISVGLMLVGIVVGNVAVKQTTRTQSHAQQAPSTACPAVGSVCYGGEQYCTVCENPKTNSGCEDQQGTGVTNVYQCIDVKTPGFGTGQLQWKRQDNECQAKCAPNSAPLPQNLPPGIICEANCKIDKTCKDLFSSSNNKRISYYTEVPDKYFLDENYNNNWCGCKGGTGGGCSGHSCGYTTDDQLLKDYCAPPAGQPPGTTSGCKTGEWVCNTTIPISCADKATQDNYNSKWCDGEKKWKRDVAIGSACGGEESLPKGDPNCKPSTNQPPSGQIECETRGGQCYSNSVCSVDQNDYRGRFGCAGKYPGKDNCCATDTAWKPPGTSQPPTTGTTGDAKCPYSSQSECELDKNNKCTADQCTTCTPKGGNQDDGFKCPISNQPATCTPASAGWFCGSQCADQATVNKYTDKWCDGLSEWKWETAGGDQSCGGTQQTMLKYDPNCKPSTGDNCKYNSYSECKDALSDGTCKGECKTCSNGKVSCGPSSSKSDNPCTSCDGNGRCIYHPEKDWRSGRATPPDAVCTDTGCINDSECQSNRTCAKNGEDCGDNKTCCTGTNITGLKVDLKCNAAKKCEPIPIEQPKKCDDFYDQDNSKAQAKCKDACGSRGCEQVPFAGGYVTNCWRCNTQNYCAFLEDKCTQAGKPDYKPDQPSTQKNISESGKTSCGLPIGTYNNGKDLSTECVSCIAQKEDWLKTTWTGDDGIRKVDNIKTSCTDEEVAKYWCTGRIPGETTTKSSDNCYDKYITGSCSSVCKNVQKGSSTPPSSGTTTLKGNGCSITLPNSVTPGNSFSSVVTSSTYSNAANVHLAFTKGNLTKTFDPTKTTVGNWEFNNNIKLDETGDYSVKFTFKAYGQGNKTECEDKTTLTVSGSSASSAPKCNPVADAILDPCAKCMNSQVNGIPGDSSDCPTLQQKVNFYCTKSDNYTKCTNAFNDICLKSTDSKSQCTEPQRRTLFMSPQSFNNDNFDTVIEGMKSGLINAKYASLYVLNATRVPGLQRLYCDPFQGQCDYYYQQNGI